MIAKKIVWRTLLIPVFVCIAPSVWGQSALMESVARLQNYSAQRASSANPDLHSNGDARSIAAGETLVLAEMDGPGMITHIWTTVGSIDPFYPQSLVVRMYWDGLERPSVEAPLGDFFGVGNGAHADFTSLPVATSSRGRSRNCFWQMPFAKSAKITVTNESTRYDTDSFYYYVDWRKYDALPDGSTYFHAQYRQAMPATPGDYTILETEGRGHYVGTVYSVQQMETGWFGEGDDRFYIDDEEAPSLRGTGTEDYFNDSWGFRAFATPYHGVSLWEGYFPGDRVTAYRWHLDSPVPFSTSLKVTIEHKGSIFTDKAVHLGQFIERPDWISSVAFWYQESPQELTAGLLPPAQDRIAPYTIIAAADLTLRGDPKGMMLRDKVSVTYAPGKPDASLEIDFEVAEAGRYQINAIMAYGFYGGVYQPLLDGKAIRGPIDFCDTGLDPIWTRFDLHDLEAGTHTLRFEGRGASPNMRSLAPPYYGLGIYYLVLLRMEDMAGYHEMLQMTLENK